VDCRIKLFVSDFEADYRLDEFTRAKAAITFIYISGAGKGLQVLAV
jgi:hypothetical protein